MQNFVDEKWMKATLEQCFAKLNPVILSKMEKKFPGHVATYRDVVMPANQINFIPNLAPMLASAFNQACQQIVTAAVSKRPTGKTIDARRTIELPIHIHIPKKGDTVRRATAFDKKGNVTEMTETEI